MQLVFIEIGYHNVCDIHERNWTVIIAIVNVSSSCISKKQMPPEYVLDLSHRVLAQVVRTLKHNLFFLYVCNIFSLGIVLMQ